MQYGVTFPDGPMKQMGMSPTSFKTVSVSTISSILEMKKSSIVTTYSAWRMGKKLSPESVFGIEILVYKYIDFENRRRQHARGHHVIFSK